MFLSFDFFESGSYIDYGCCRVDQFVRQNRRYSGLLLSHRMSSDRPDDSTKQDSSFGDASSAGGSDATEGSTADSERESVECPNCGRRFVGTYCPDCGQEIGQSVTVGDIAGDAVREVADIEGGFLETLVGLTLRPGQVLQQYLSGVRRQFMSPGRYLTVAVLLYVGSLQLLTWLEIRQGLAGVVADPSGEEVEFEGFQEAFTGALQSQWFALGTTLLSAGIFGLILWRLFRDKLNREAEALAIAVFLVAHAAILVTGIRLVFMPPVYLLMGDPLHPAIFMGLGTVLMIVYPAVAAHLGFGRDWKSAVKAVFGALWAYLEAGLIGGVALLWYLIWILPSFPPEAVSDDLQAFYLSMVILSAVYLLPLFLHTGVEAYYRLSE